MMDWESFLLGLNIGLWVAYILIKIFDKKGE